VLQSYHHQTTLDSLCKELHKSGHEKEARTLQMSSDTAEDDVERSRVLLHLTKIVRALRSRAKAYEIYVVNTTVSLLIILKDEPEKVDRLFGGMKPKGAAEKAADLLIENVQLDMARKKLFTDYSDSSDSSVAITTVINTRQSIAASWFSMYKARAGGMDKKTYYDTVVEDAKETVREHAKLLSKEVREKLGI
jgi:hypothetical protein